MLRRLGLVFGAVALGAITIVAACSSNPPATTCSNNDTRTCVGPGACAGGQVCTSGAWSPCDCGGVGDGGPKDAGNDALDAAAEASEMAPYQVGCPQVDGSPPMVRIGNGDAGFCVDTYAPTADQIKSAQLNSTSACNPQNPCPPSITTTGAQINTCVPWCMAEKYCVQLGKRLCTTKEITRSCYSATFLDYPWGQDASALDQVCFTGTFPPNAAVSDCHPADPPNKYGSPRGLMEAQKREHGVALRKTQAIGSHAEGSTS
jgi:hypothetical protein